MLYECCIFNDGYRWCYVHVGYAMLCTDDAMYMLEIQCYVQVMLHICFTCGAMYIWCGVQD